MLIHIILVLAAAAGDLQSGHALRFIQEDYTREDLLQVSSAGNAHGTETACTWKVSEETLEQQSMYTWETLLSQVPAGEMSSYAIQFLNMMYREGSGEIPRLSTFEYATVNDARFGHDPATPRNDWVLVFNFRREDQAAGAVPEKVYMLPDGTIIISSGNLAGIS